LRGSTLASYPLSGYSVGGATNTVSSEASSTELPGKSKGYWSLQRLKRSYLDYLGTKREEIDEQQDSRRMINGSQWTQAQLKDFALRKQPTTTNNKIIRKIDGIIGTIERLKQDPKAYPRTPMHEEGAELATGSLRYALEAQNWSAKDPVCARMAASEGFGGLEFNLIQGDKGDTEVEISVVQTDSFFYDPRSFLHDFSDASYMGVGKWMDIDSAIDLFPDSEVEIRDSVETGSELSSEPDREFKWFHSYGETPRVRVVEAWYKHKGEWCYCIFTGNVKLMEGKSYLLDEKGQAQSKYEMFSCYIDQDGDRYGFIRHLKPLQQQINYRESKTIQLMHTRQIMFPKGAFDDAEKARREAARPDGMIEYNMGVEKPDFNDGNKQADIAAQFKYLENVKTDFETFGPNIAVTGEGLENSSGRAIQLLQQSGLADLGPFIQSYRDWKIRVYRKMWNAIQKHWTGERWIRVTDDDKLKQLVGINQVQTDPMTGQPVMVNAIGSLDVDILIDEGPDTVNQMGDAYDTLTALAQKGAEIPPAILIELSPLMSSVKKKLLEMLNPTDEQSQQEQQMVKQLQLKQAEADVMDKMASAKMKEAQAIKALAEANAPPEQQMGDDPNKVNAEVMESHAKIAKIEAEIEKIRMDAAKVHQEMQLEPQRMAMEQQNKQQEMQFNFQSKNAEMQQKSADRDEKARQSDQKTLVSLDGTLKDQITAENKTNSDNISQLGKAMVKAVETSAKSLEKASDAMANAAQGMSKALTAKKRLLRDANGRAIGAETIE
jgi:hypothetical protein